MNIAAETLSFEPHSDVVCPLFVVPLSSGDAFSENQRRRELIRAFGSPGGFGEAESGESFEEERKTPLEVKREKGENGRFRAEERGVVPIEVTGDFGGDEVLRSERRSGGGAE